MADPGALGYPDALVIRNCRVPSVMGCPDVVMLPRSGPHRIVLIEAKAAKAKDAASQVVGQLLMYYGGALTLGSIGLEHYLEYAARNPDQAKDHRRTSVAALAGKLYRKGAGDGPLIQGKPLDPGEIGLFIAMDQQPHPSLMPTLAALRLHNGIQIGVLVVSEGKITSVETPKPDSA